MDMICLKALKYYDTYASDRLKKLYVSFVELQME